MLPCQRIFIALFFVSLFTVPLPVQQAFGTDPVDSPKTPIVGSITKLVLYDAKDDVIISAFDPLTSGAVVSTSDLGTTEFSIVAEVTGTVGSVAFSLDGTDPYRIESVAPYALNGDNQQGNYGSWIPSIGSHTVSATPYSLGGSNGDAGTTFTITFEVTDGSGGGGNIPPVASFTASPQVGDAPLTVSFDANASNPGETDGTDSIIYSWDFGDGTSGTGAIYTHTYITIGDYTTSLTVTDESSATDTATKLIDVNDPSNGSGGDGAFLESGGLVSIEGESFFTSTTVSPNEWLTKTSASSSNAAPSGYSGSAAMYAADDAIENNYSPGVGPEMTYEVTFTTTGVYNIWARVWVDDHNSDRLHAGLDGNWQNGQDTKGSYMIESTYDSWQWTNDRASSGNQAYMTIDTPGTYTINIWMQKDGIYFDKLVLMTDDVSVEVLEGMGPAESPRDGCETDCNSAPVANFSAVPSDTEFKIDFTSSSTDDGTIISWDWDFDDGTGTGETTSHTYSGAGNYNVMLTVIDDAGATGSTTKLVSVTGDGGGTGTGAYLESAGKVVMEAENAQGIFTGDNGNSDGSDDLNWVIATDQSGYSGTSAMQALPNNGTLIGTTYVNDSPELRFDVQFSQSGQYWVWVRMRSTGDQHNSVHAGFNGINQESAKAIEETTYNSWTWSKNRKNTNDDAYLDVTSGLHTVSIWMREDGVYIDKVLLTTDVNYTPTGLGDAESPRDDGSTDGNQDPIASFTHAQTGLSADFTDTSTDDGTIEAWSWDFGDGNTASTENPTHVYASSGTYTVTLTVTDEQLASGTTNQSITVSSTNSPPTVEIIVTPGTTVLHGEEVSLDAGGSDDPDGDPISIDWFIVDGSIETPVTSSDGLYIHTAASSGETELLRVKVSDGSLVSIEDVLLTLTDQVATTYYYVKDHLGSVRATVNEFGTIVSHTDYYPFGLEMPGRSTLIGVNQTKENYTGHQLDTETGLVYAGARYLMPEIGRWTSVDPLAEKHLEWTPYNYVLNNPLLLLDPDGRQHEHYVYQAIRQKANGDKELEKQLLQQEYKANAKGKTLVFQNTVGFIAEPIDWIMTAYDAYNNGPNLLHAAALLPFFSSGSSRLLGVVEDKAGSLRLYARSGDTDIAATNLANRFDGEASVSIEGFGNREFDLLSNEFVGQTTSSFSASINPKNFLSRARRNQIRTTLNAARGLNKKALFEFTNGKPHNDVIDFIQRNADRKGVNVVFIFGE